MRTLLKRCVREGVAILPPEYRPLDKSDFEEGKDRAISAQQLEVGTRCLLRVRRFAEGEPYAEECEVEIHAVNALMRHCRYDVQVVPDVVWVEGVSGGWCRIDRRGYIEHPQARKIDEPHPDAIGYFVYPSTALDDDLELYGEVGALDPAVAELLTA